MNEKKLTKRDYFNELLTINEVATNKGLVDFINHELELLDRKSSGKPTKNQVENDGIMYDIITELERIGNKVTITDLQNQSEILKDYSNQKLSALLKKLVESDKVEKTVDKKKSYFSIKNVD